ncbi:MAG: carboxypeptidase regulatory-like domain-containing protein [Bacteroidetes bacterium]|nr:carboxypeptidase regulatory-like domain-containing protein [Bacteroidota bacterium]
MKLFGKLILFVTLSCFAVVAKADNEKPESVLHGYVKDAVTKKPVSGVQVSASASGLNVARIVTTDADGYFSFGQLPVPQVDLKFGKKGYQAYERNNIAVKEKTTVKISVEFQPLTDDDGLDNIDFPLLKVLQLE